MSSTPKDFSTNSIIYRARTRYSIGMVNWNAAFGTASEPTPLAYDPFKRDDDARRWFNSGHTNSFRLYEALCYFVTTGLGEEALDEFVEGIKPKWGWAEDRPPSTPAPPEYRRARSEYSNEVKAMLGGYWRKK